MEIIKREDKNIANCCFTRYELAVKAIRSMNEWIRFQNKKCGGKLFSLSAYVHTRDENVARFNRRFINLSEGETIRVLVFCNC